MITARLFFAELSLAALLFAACGQDQEQTPQTESANPAGANRVVHVHGLGINPKDGVLYAATHTGLFRISADGVAERVGERFQDTMGFTVVGPDKFLGSGHPDVRDYRAGRLPPLLGLISSDDAGKTWQSMSLSGKADFHSLSIAHGQVFGFDSTGEAFMVSKDGGKSWETRSKVALIAFSVSPLDASTVVATTGGRTLKSVDGGKTWRPGNAPSFVLVSWPAADRFWGVDAKGIVSLSEDGGSTWRQTGALPGPPEAFLDAGNALYAAVQGQGIFTSDDSGRTWRVFYRDPA